MFTYWLEFLESRGSSKLQFFMPGNSYNQGKRRESESIFAEFMTRSLCHLLTCWSKSIVAKLFFFI